MGRKEVDRTFFPPNEPSFLSFSCTVDWPILPDQLFSCLFLQPVLRALLTEQFQQAQLSLSAAAAAGLNCQLKICLHFGRRFSIVALAISPHQFRLNAKDKRFAKCGGTLCCREKGHFSHPFK